MAGRDSKGRFVPRFTVAKDNGMLQRLIEELQENMQKNAVIDKRAHEIYGAVYDPTATAVQGTLQKEDTRMDLFEKKELIRRAEGRLGVSILGGNDPKNLLAHASARREALHRELRDITFLEDFAALMEKYPEQFAE